MLTVQLEYVLAYIFSECNSSIEEKPLMNISREILQKSLEKGHYIDCSLDEMPQRIPIIRKWISDGLIEYNENTNSFKPYLPAAFKVILNQYESYYPKLNEFKNNIKETLDGFNGN